MSDAPPVSGYCHPRFAAVRAAFAENLAAGEDLGAAFAAFVEGEPVVDLIGGWSDRAKQTPWTEQTLACVYSSGKAVVAMLMARAVSDGRLDYEARVSDVWPAFAAAGKDRISIAELLSHQGGLCGFTEPMPPEDWLDRGKIVDRLAAMAPLWPPGTRSGYHPQTYGFLANELLIRATGRSFARQLRVDFATPFGLNIACGLDEAQIARAAYMPKPPRAPDLGALTPLKEAAFLKPWSAPGRVAREAWLAAELPASNTHADARALAEIVHPLADGGRFRGKALIDPAAIERALAVRVEGDDLVLPFTLAWAAGLMRNRTGHFGPSDDAYGHAGFGGSTVMLDPPRRLSAAYVMNRMSPHLVGDPRGVRLIEALYSGL